MGKVCCTLLQRLLYSRLLSKQTEMTVLKPTNMSGVLYGCETLCLTMKIEHGLRVRHESAEKNI